MLVKILVIALVSTSSGYAGYVSSPGGYVFHQNPAYQTYQPVFQRPLTHYTQPSYVQIQRPQQVTSSYRPQVVAIHAERPQQQLVESRPQFVAIQAERPQQVIATPARPALVQQYPGIVAIQAQHYEPAPTYSYGYSVKDITTGDEKSHHETRNGDNVVGKYSLVEPDGTLRTVTYTAGKDGFNAVVERTANYAPPNEPAKLVATKPLVIASPGHPVASAVAVPVASNYPSGFHFGG